MLEQIELSIKNLPSISFEEYYTYYVENTQDTLISSEVSHLSSLIYGVKSIASAEKSIERLVERMVSQDDIFS